MLCAVTFGTFYSLFQCCFACNGFSMSEDAGISLTSFCFNAALPAMGLVSAKAYVSVNVMQVSMLLVKTKI